MGSWRDSILSNFVPNISKLTLVADPDGLLTEEKLGVELRNRGFDLMEFTDPIEFRYAYESKYRAQWDQGLMTDLVVSLRVQDMSLEKLPYDLLLAGRQLSFNLGELFPHFSYPVMQKMGVHLMDDIYDAQQARKPERMGDNATIDFVLRNVFNVAPELIHSDTDLLKALLQLHYRNATLPDVLAIRLYDILAMKPLFKGWPLKEIIPHSEAFYAFLQERWNRFIVLTDASTQVRENISTVDLSYSGPEKLPFEHHDIRVYMDSLFLEGKLTPVLLQNAEITMELWMRNGIATTASDNRELRLSRLIESIEDAIPNPEARYIEWMAFASRWAEITALSFGGSSTKVNETFDRLSKTIQDCFATWLHRNYSGLINLPPTQPVMVHHVSRSMARELDRARKMALIVMDGLSMDQWVTVRQVVQERKTDLVMRESALFAWVPTLTSVSRQALFSGKIPMYYSNTINTTNAEEKHWKQFWEGQGVHKSDVVYQRGLGDGDVSAVLDELINPGKTRIAGLVVDKVDKIMHGMQLGSAGMHNQIRQWMDGGYLISLIHELMGLGFEVWLTSDHGNIEARGCGRPAEGVLAETRGERVRVYPSMEMQSSVASSYPFGHRWNTAGLPDQYYPFVLSSREAFSQEGSVVVAHGGISLEEVIVPLVHFRVKKQHE